MVLFNHSTRELTAKIVYYGPGLCGKTTNLRLLHEKLDRGTTGRLLSLSTAQDRTIYFDLLPVELGNVKGYTVRFQLCTVPGQVFYNETRKLVLKGVDGIVFVVDSQWSMLSHNLESFQNLRENMAELGQGFEETALVVQYNKRDLPGVLSVQALQESLGFQEFPFVESVAADARGVVETFRLVSKLTFVQLLKRLQRSPDGERLGPDWVASTPPNSQSTARIPVVGAELLALTSTVGPAPPPPTDSPFDTTGSWPGLVKGEVFGDTTAPPFPEPAPETAAPDAEDTFTEAPPSASAEPEPEPLPELSLPPQPEPVPEPEPGPPAEPLPAELPPPAELLSPTEPLTAAEKVPAAQAGAPAVPQATVEAVPETPLPVPVAVPPVSTPPEAETVPLFEPFAVGPEAIAPAPETPLPAPEPPVAAPRPESPPAAVSPDAEAPAAAPGTPAPALEPPAAAPAPPPAPPPAPEAPAPPPPAAVWAEAFAALSARLDEMARVHSDESARVEALARETREAVASLSANVADALASLESKVTGLEAVHRETVAVRRLVETRLEEAGGQSRRLSGFLRRALEELEPPGKG